MMTTLPTDYSHQQLVEALQNEWEYLIHDDFIEGEDMTAEEHLKYLQSMTHSQLVDEIDFIDIEGFNTFMSLHSSSLF